MARVTTARTCTCCA